MRLVQMYSHAAPLSHERQQKSWFDEIGPDAGAGAGETTRLAATAAHEGARFGLPLHKPGCSMDKAAVDFAAIAESPTAQLLPQLDTCPRPMDTHVYGRTSATLRHVVVHLLLLLRT